MNSGFVAGVEKHLLPASFFDEGSRWGAFDLHDAGELLGFVFIKVAELSSEELLAVESQLPRAAGGDEPDYALVEVQKALRLCLSSSSSAETNYTTLNPGKRYNKNQNTKGGYKFWKQRGREQNWGGRYGNKWGIEGGCENKGKGNEVKWDSNGKGNGNGGGDKWSKGGNKWNNNSRFGNSSKESSFRGRKPSRENEKYSGERRNSRSHSGGRTPRNFGK